MYLASVDLLVPVDPSLQTDSQRVAVVEDLWWCVQVQEWRRRRPPWWRLSARWRAQARELAEKRERIADLLNG